MLIVKRTRSKAMVILFMIYSLAFNEVVYIHRRNKVAADIKPYVEKREL